MIQIRKGDPDYPSCNFCTKKDIKIFELFSSAEGRNQVISICTKCLIRLNTLIGIKLKK